MALAAAGDDRRRLKGRGRWRLFAGIWLVYLAPAFHQAWTGHTGADRVVRLVLLAAFCWVYADLVARALTGVEWLRWAAPALLVAVGTVLAVLVGPESLGAAVYVVVAVAVLQPFRVALPVAVAGTLLVGVLPWLVPHWRSHDSWSAAGSVALGSLAAFGFMALLRRTQELRAAQQEVSRLAAERERMRIARDLHDLLGQSLTAVTVKAQLAGRLVGRDDVRAAAEITAVERLSRQALADVRAAVAGYREVSLAVELATAREVLGAAGIAADLPARGGRGAGGAARALRLGGARGGDQRGPAQRRAPAPDRGDAVVDRGHRRRAGPARPDRQRAGRAGRARRPRRRAPRGRAGPGRRLPPPPHCPHRPRRFRRAATRARRARRFRRARRARSGARWACRRGPGCRDGAGRGPA